MAFNDYAYCTTAEILRQLSLLMEMASLQQAWITDPDNNVVKKDFEEMATMWRDIQERLEWISPEMPHCEHSIELGDSYKNGEAS